jgi:hypothetical protein
MHGLRKSRAHGSQVRDGTPVVSCLYAPKKCIRMCLFLGRVSGSTRFIAMASLDGSGSIFLPVIRDYIFLCDHATSSTLSESIYL